MQKRLGHSRLIYTLNPPIQPKPRAKNAHLNKRIGAHPVARNKVLAVLLELKRLAVILADEVREAGFCEADACEE
jgi:hypothetical protein